MNPFQKLVVRVCHINLEDAAVKFNVEQALRATLQRGIEIGRKEKPDCRQCALWRAEQIRLTGNIEMFADPNTERHPTANWPEWMKKRHPDKVETSRLPPVRITRDLRYLIGTDEREKKIS